MRHGDAVTTDVVVIGAGISGLVAAKCLKDAGFQVVLIERTGEVGGLWSFKEHGYGVMRFTHINVSKQNYSFSDFPFPDDVVDFPHHSDMAKYVANYTTHFGLNELIKFQTQVNKIERKGEQWELETALVEDDGIKGFVTSQKQHISARFVAIATGHHAKPSIPKFPGQETFKGHIFHSVDYKDAITNRITGKRVLIVGIGNSAVDAAVNAAAVGRCPSVYLSTRSGAWVVPNYVFGHPVDHYACRLFLWLPWKLTTFIFEKVVTLILGSPFKWNLNPKMHALQTQPTVSPTLIHHIQRGQIKVVPNIQKIEGSQVFFTDGQSSVFDEIILCTGYNVDMPFLGEDIRNQVVTEGTNKLKLYKNVFSPSIGSSMAFIGFVQPASGGVLTMSETQSRWFAEICKGNVKLPGEGTMLEDIKQEEEKASERWYSSARHTIQKDPIIYNDEIASFFGAKPQFWKHPTLAWRLLVGSCGSAQWRLQGPHKWDSAYNEVKKVPLTGLMHYGVIIVIGLLLSLLTYLTTVIWSFI